jgi:hypothetical protein
LANLKTLRVCLEFDDRDLCTARRINNCQAAIAVADYDVSVPGINANIVGVAMQIEFADGCEIRRVENPHRAVTRIRDIDEIRLVRIGDALRFLEVANALNYLAGADIDHLYGVVSERGHDEMLPAAINRHVVDAPAHVRQREGRLEHQRLCGCNRSLGNCQRDQERQSDGQTRAGHAPSHL